MIKNVENLSNMELDVLREVGNIGAGNAITALSKMINKRVDMKIPEVRIVQFEKVNEILGDAENIVVGILIRVEGDFCGHILFILSLRAARIIVNMVMGKPPREAGDFSEIEISALKEIGNILAGSYLSALSALTNLMIKPTVPQIAIDMAGAILSVPAIEFGKTGDSVLYIETEFSEGNTKVVGDFFLVPDIESYDILLKALGVIG